MHVPIIPPRPRPEKVSILLLCAAWWCAVSTGMPVWAYVARCVALGVVVALCASAILSIVQAAALGASVSAPLLWLLNYMDDENGNS